MINHISIGCNNLQVSTAFYDFALKPLGFERVCSGDDFSGYGRSGESDDQFAVKRRDAFKPPGAGFHVAFTAQTRKAVDEFYRSALNFGGRDDGEPGLRPHYGPTYYAAFVIDPDGHRIEAVCHHHEQTAEGALKPKSNPRIQTERLILRLPAVSDVSEIINYFRNNDAHLSPFDPKKPDDFYTEEYWRSRIPKHSEEFLEDRALRLYLFNKRDDREIIGSLEFSQISRGPFQACYLGYGLAEKNQGRGLMFEALSAAIGLAFNELNIHRVMANHLPDNGRSERLLQRLGFQREGVAKDYLRINGGWRDHVLNSLHNPDWRQL
ncbi:MAG: hypothetical protein C5B49_10405 [Bdellovibrio sp.]|nr:MAG: hypothetical protein C5B49_10405 [Bdellovibrio sp.]